MAVNRMGEDSIDNCIFAKLFAKTVVLFFQYMYIFLTISYWRFTFWWNEVSYGGQQLPVMLSHFILQLFQQLFCYSHKNIEEKE